MGFILFLPSCAALRDESSHLLKAYDTIQEDDIFKQAEIHEFDPIFDGFCRDDVYTTYLKNQFISTQSIYSLKAKSEMRAWHRTIENRSMNHVSKILTPRTSSYFGAIPVMVTDEVEMWIRYFKTTGRETFTKWLIRGETVKEVLHPLLKEEGMPEEFFYLSMIESGFSNTAASHAQAVGPWQFVAATGRMYGLKINYWFDERRDPIKSTAAAANYLRDLYVEFGDWYLAMAAYNAGPGKIRLAIRKTNSRNFWDLIKTPWIEIETKHYVPKVLAALILGANPQKYGFAIEANPMDKIPSAMTRIKEPVKLQDIAYLIGVSPSMLRKWNPELIKNITPPPRWNEPEGYPLRLPAKYIAQLESLKSELKVVEVNDVHIHKISQGDTLSRIAKLYKVPIPKIMEFNPSLSPQRLRVGKTIVVPIPYYSET